jgi:hypothetical protein
MALTRPFLDVELATLMSFFDALTEAEEDRQKEVVRARKYHEGTQGVELTERLEQFLSTDFDFGMNVCRNVVSALVERLRVTGFDTTDEELMDWASNVWNNNNLDATQEDIYEGALRDGEYFAIVSWEDGVSVIPHQRYTDVQVEGDGFGCWMVYKENDPNQKPEYGVKQWTESTETMGEVGIIRQAAQRRNLYYPDRVEKYRRDFNGEWEQFQPSEDEEWPVPWTDSEGKPLGVALIHFTNKGLRCEAWDAFPLQDAVNKSLLDLLSSSDLTAFRIFYSLGFIPTTDGKPPAEDRSNWLKLEPGQVVGTTKSARETDFGSIEPAELRELMDLTHQLVLWLAMVTNTPVSRFISTKLIASDATLKEQEGPLLSRVTSRQVRFGNAWARCLDIARRLENEFGDGGLNEDEKIDLIWAEGAARGEDEKLDLLQKKQGIGIPHKQLWKEAGYNQKTIDQMETERDAERRDQFRDGNRGNGNRNNGNRDGNGIDAANA